jgi:hypothetical protein
MALVIVHAKKNGVRSTVSMERRLAELLSIRLCGHVDLAQLKPWCEAQMQNDPGAFERGVSQRLAALAVLEVADESLKKTYLKWLEEGHNRRMAKILATRVRRKASR